MNVNLSLEEVRAIIAKGVKAQIGLDEYYAHWLNDIRDGKIVGTWYAVELSIDYVNLELVHEEAIEVYELYWSEIANEWRDEGLDRMGLIY